MKTLKSLTRFSVLALVLVLAAFGHDYTVQGPNGPEPAKRPDAQTLEFLKSDDLSIADRYTLAKSLAAAGFTLDAPVDVFGWDFDKTMALRRGYGYKWVPAIGMPPVVIAPGLNVPGLPSYSGDNPPIGAILVPSEDADKKPATKKKK